MFRVKVNRDRDSQGGIHLIADLEFIFHEVLTTSPSSAGCSIKTLPSWISNFNGIRRYRGARYCRRFSPARGSIQIFSLGFSRRFKVEVEKRYPCQGHLRVLVLEQYSPWEIGPPMCGHRS